ncbi:hypothetical protein SAMN06295974_3523 [Plantibacter flavus]|uniref:Uncharacterized protein n=1 Tax=Plantibacter flavus TaxID=150123 RepID=A0A3N2C6D7_9MICO|nr:hypothetical protein [Plantibacter flavus]ROR83073.1 hypothetical protein EDD42_3175 [Plantibacter flavus]SMG46567.1 hypothetical protein SAMN06295974_3523 [Plantibacter flavus]
MTTLQHPSTTGSIPTPRQQLAALPRTLRRRIPTEQRQRIHTLAATIGGFILVTGLAGAFITGWLILLGLPAAAILIGATTP